jgi:hypothetical protein
MSLISTTLNVALSVVLTSRLGPIGALLGTLAALLVCNVWYLPLVLGRVFQTPLRGLIGAVARPLAWGVPFGVLLWLSAQRHEPLGWIGLATEMAVASLVFLALSWVAIFGPDERAVWRLRLRLLLRPRPAV